MGNDVYVLSQTYRELQEKGFEKEVIETIREEFRAYKSGGAFDHPWFCHDVGPDPRKYMRHVHFIPTKEEDETQWLADFDDKHKNKRRTSNRYVLYASDPRHGHLIIDILDDGNPGAHAVWSARRTKLEPYELEATDFCTFGPKSGRHQ